MKKQTTRKPENRKVATIINANSQGQKDVKVSFSKTNSYRTFKQGTATRQATILILKLVQHEQVFVIHNCKNKERGKEKQWRETGKRKTELIFAVKMTKRKIGISVFRLSKYRLKKTRNGGWIV